jgi:hypothetical protein
MRTVFLAAALTLGLASHAGAPDAFAADSDRVGYGTPIKIQMMPMMAPYRTSSGVRYHVLTVRLVLNPSPEKERPACFMVPVLHEKILMYLHKAKLVQADFSGQRLDVLREKILDIAVANTDKTYFASIEFLDDQSMLPSGGTSAGSSSGAAGKAVTAAKGDDRIAKQRQEARAEAGVSGGAATATSTLDPRSQTLSSQCK